MNKNLLNNMRNNVLTINQYKNIFNNQKIQLLLETKNMIFNNDNFCKEVEKNYNENKSIYITIIDNDNENILMLAIKKYIKDIYKFNCDDIENSIILSK